MIAAVACVIRARLLLAAGVALLAAACDSKHPVGSADGGMARAGDSGAALGRGGANAGPGGSGGIGQATAGSGGRMGGGAGATGGGGVGGVPTIGGSGGTAGGGGFLGRRWRRGPRRRIRRRDRRRTSRWNRHGLEMERGRAGPPDGALPALWGRRDGTGHLGGGKPDQPGDRRGHSVGRRPVLLARYGQAAETAFLRGRPGRRR